MERQKRKGRRPRPQTDQKHAIYRCGRQLRFARVPQEPKGRRPRPKLARNTPITAADGNSVLRVFLKSAKAAEARLQTGKKLAIIRRRSESVLRVFLRSAKGAVRALQTGQKHANYRRGRQLRFARVPQESARKTVPYRVHWALATESVAVLHSFFLRLILLLAFSIPAADAQVLLHMHFSSIQRMLANQVFTQEGRRFVKGKSDKQCSFAYLERPVVGSEQGRLRIRARFSGRSAIDLFGKCVGMGDAFDLSILATPQYKTGSVVFKDVMVESYGQDSFYKKQVRRAMAASLERDFRYPLAAEARRILEQAELAAGFRRELSDFDVTGIHVSQDSVIFSLRFHLAVK